MFGDFLTIEADRHEIMKDGAWVKKVREVVHNPNIFVYRHRVEKNTFVVCEWMDKPRTCTELFIVDAPPDHSPTNMPSMPTIAHRCRPMIEMFDDMRGKIHKKNYDKAVGEMESTERRLDAADYLGKNGMDEAAFQHTAGCAPYASDIQSTGMMDETVENLTDLASTKVHSTSVVGEKRAKHKMK